MGMRAATYRRLHTAVNAEKRLRAVAVNWSRCSRGLCRSSWPSLTSESAPRANAVRDDAAEGRRRKLEAVQAQQKFSAELRPREL